MRRAVIFVLVASMTAAHAQPAPDAGAPPQPTPAPAPPAPPPDMPINMPPAPAAPPDRPAPARSPAPTPSPAPAPSPGPAPAPSPSPAPAPTTTPSTAPSTTPTPTPPPESAPTPAAETTTEPAPDLVPAPDADATPETPATAIGTSRNKDAAWLLVGGALTFLTAGAVLAYSTSSVEQDLRDLYVTADGSPPEFDPATQERYEALQREGRRYEILSWTSFGVAAACAAGAAYFFVRASNESAVTVTPVATPTTAGASVSVRF